MASSSSSQSVPKYINEEVLDALVCLIDNEARISRIDPYPGPPGSATSAIVTMNQYVGCCLKQFVRLMLQTSSEPRTISLEQVRSFIRTTNQQVGIQS